MRTHKVIKGSAILAGAQFIARSFDLVAMIVIARLLTPEDFGLVALASSVMLVVNSATDLPVVDSLVQRRDLKPGDLDTGFTLGLIRGVTVAIVLFILATPISIFFEDHRLSEIIYVLSLVPIAAGLASPKMVHFQRKLNFSPAAIAQLVGKLLALISALLVAWLSGSYWALIFGLVLGPVTAAVLSYVFAPYFPRLRLKGSMEFWNFAGWVTASRILWTANMQADRFFVGSILGKTPLGYYTVGSDLASTATYSLAQPAIQPLFSGFSRIADDRSRLRAAYQKGQQVLMAVIMPVGVGLAVVAPQLTALLLGEKWLPIVPVLAWLAPVIALQMLTIAVQAVTMATGKTRMLALREVVNLAVRMPVTILAAWWFGLIGAVIARALTGVAFIVYNLHLADKILELPIGQQIVNCWRSLASAAGMAGVTLLAGHALPEAQNLLEQILFLAGQVAVGAITYFTIHIILWILQGKPDGVEKIILHYVTNRSALA